MSLDTIAIARKRFEKLSAIIKAADEAREEFHELDNLLRTADRINTRLSSRKVIPLAPVPRRHTVTKNATAIAEYVFRMHGPNLHLDQILERMLENGWVGNGNRKTNLMAVYTLLASNPKFKALGKAVFELHGNSDTAPRTVKESTSG